MSTTGKVFIFLNLLGLVGLSYAGLQLYGKSQAYSYSYFLSDLTENGLPFDQTELDDQGQPIYKKIGEQAKDDLFKPIGGSPVTTQLEEVTKVRNDIKAKVDGEPDTLAKIRKLSEILMPLARSNRQRERLIALQTQLANDKTITQLKADLAQSMRPALLLMMNPETPKELTRKLTFVEAYGEAVHQLRALPGQPLEVLQLRVSPRDLFVTALTSAFGKGKVEAADAAARNAAKDIASKDVDQVFLAAARGEQGKAFQVMFDESFNEILQTLSEKLQAELDDQFNEVVEGQRTVLDAEGTTSKAKVSESGRKAAAALLMFNLLELDEPELPRDLLTSAKYRRLMTIVGLPRFIEAINTESQVLTKIAADLDREIQTERATFITSDQQILAVLKNRSRDAEGHETRLRDQQRVTQEAVTLAATQKERVASYEGYIKAAREKSATEIKKLRDMTETLHKIRVDALNAGKNLQTDLANLEKLEKTSDTKQP